MIHSVCQNSYLNIFCLYSLCFQLCRILACLDKLCCGGCGVPLTLQQSLTRQARRIFHVPRFIKYALKTLNIVLFLQKNVEIYAENILLALLTQ